MEKKTKLPTAKELLKANFLLIEEDKTCECHTHLVTEQMIIFARMHVKKALKVAAKNCILSLKTITQAYPDSNIK